MAIRIPTGAIFKVENEFVDKSHLVYHLKVSSAMTVRTELSLIYLSFVVLPRWFFHSLNQVDSDKTAGEFINVVAVCGTQSG
jgi:hypothetical protein